MTAVVRNARPLSAYRTLVQVDAYRCTGCHICTEACIPGVLRMKNGKAVPVFLDDCMTCFLCQLECPRYAIRVTPQHF